MTDETQKAMLAHSPILLDSGNAPWLDDFLEYVHTHSGEDVQGLAFATNGTWPVLGFNKRSSTKTLKLSVPPIYGRNFDPMKVFELRIWVPVKLPNEPAEGAVLAHEYRWVNDVGAIELRVTAGTDSSQPSASKKCGVTGWVHAVQYLHHVPSSRSTPKPTTDSLDNESDQSGEGTTTGHMTALEFIQEEKQYGNMAVTDQLFTGEWTK